MAGFMIIMATEKKNKNNRSLSANCDQTYVYNNCSRTLVFAQQDSDTDSTATSTMSSDMSPDMSPIRVQTVGCRHQRKGAVREKRSVSQNRIFKSSHRQTDVGVDTVNGIPTVETVGARAADGNSVDAIKDKLKNAGNDTADDVKPTVIVEDDKGHFVRPFIDFASISEELMMTPIGPSADMLNDGIEEFPAYVPWKATYKWPENSTSGDEAAGSNAQRSDDGDGRSAMCQVCRKCRCMACQQNCKYPKTTVCNVEVSSSNAFVDAMAFMPCVKKTARCIEYVRDHPVDENTWFENPCTKQRYARPPKKWQICGFLFLCFPCFGPYYPLRCVMQCSDQCYGNLNVPGCKCVDWDALRLSCRIRGTENPYYSALSSSVAERRRRYQNQLTAENAAKAATAKASITKAVTAKADAAKADTAKTDAAKVDAAKVDAAKTNDAKTDTAKTDAAKADAAKTDDAKADAAKADAAKADGAKADAAKADDAKAKATKADAAKADDAKAKATKADATKSDAPRADAIKSDTAKAKTTKIKVVKTEATISEVAKAEAANANDTAVTIPTIATSTTFRPKPIITRITSNAAIATFADAYRVTTAIAATNAMKDATISTTEIRKTAKIDNTATKTTKTIRKTSEATVAMTEK